MMNANSQAPRHPSRETLRLLWNDPSGAKETWGTGRCRPSIERGKANFSVSLGHSGKQYQEVPSQLIILGGMRLFSTGIRVEQEQIPACLRVRLPLTTRDDLGRATPGAISKGR